LLEELRNKGTSFCLFQNFHLVIAKQTKKKIPNSSKRFVAATFNYPNFCKGSSSSKAADHVVMNL